MKLIREFVRRYPWHTAFLVTALLLAGLADGIGLSALLPVLDLAFQSDAPAGDESDLSRYVFDALRALNLEPSLGVLLMVIVVGIGLKNVLVFFAEQRIGYIAADITTELRIRLLKAITASRWRYYVDQSAGRLANSMATEAWRASTAYIFAVKLFAVLVEMVVYATVAIAVSWKATLACLAASLLILAASHGLVRISQRGGAGQTVWYRSLLGTLTDILQSVKTFKAMGRDNIAEEVLSRETHELKHHLKREVLGNAALDAAQEPMYTLVIALGVYAAIAVFSFELATVTFLVLVLAKLLKQVGKVQKQYQRMMTCESAYWALLETIERAEREAEVASGSRLPTLRRAVQLDRVSLTYGEHVVLDDLTVEIPAGELTCLIGGSGAGKTTIADLVIGLVEPTAGAVRVDGVPLAEIDLKAWRQSIGYVPQENLLLNDSVLRNVTLGAADCSREDVIRALRSAGAWDFVEQMPDGVDSVVGERGARLSGGQRQRIMLARALVHRPKLLILDEATSALDPVSEAEICQTLAQLKRHVTMLAVSHQMALGEIADRIYRLEQGRITTIDREALPEAWASQGG